MRKRQTQNAELGVLLLDVKQVAGLCNIGVSTVWQLVKNGTFPKGIKLSNRCTRWKRTDIVKWINEIGTESSESTSKMA